MYFTGLVNGYAFILQDKTKKILMYNQLICTFSIDCDTLYTWISIVDIVYYKVPEPNKSSLRFAIPINSVKSELTS